MFAMSVLLAGASVACARPAMGDDLHLSVRLEPDPPRVGSETVALRLLDGAQAPIVAAGLRLEGNMNHPGMVPSLATAVETEPGLYVAELKLTMPGAWSLVADIRLADGRRLERTLALPLVAAREALP